MGKVHILESGDCLYEPDKPRPIPIVTEEQREAAEQQTLTEWFLGRAGVNGADVCITLPTETQ